MSELVYECGCGERIKLTLSAEHLPRNHWPVPGNDMGGSLRRLAVNFDNFSAAERVTMIAFLRERYSEMTGEIRRLR